MAQKKKDRSSRQVLIEDAQILFRNFGGAESPKNRKGDRNFCVILDDDIAADLLEDGWNVKRLKPKEEEDNPPFFLQVKVKFDIRPPRIVMITSAGSVNLNAETVETLDYAEIAKCDVLINPYDWDVNGATGTTAYLKSMYVTIEEDALERKYATIHNSDEVAKVEDLLDED